MKITSLFALGVLATLGACASGSGRGLASTDGGDIGNAQISSIAGKYNGVNENGVACQIVVRSDRMGTDGWIVRVDEPSADSSRAIMTAFSSMEQNNLSDAIRDHKTEVTHGTSDEFLVLTGKAFLTNDGQLTGVGFQHQHYAHPFLGGFFRQPRAMITDYTRACMDLKRAL